MCLNLTFIDPSTRCILLKVLYYVDVSIYIRAVGLYFGQSLTGHLQLDLTDEFNS